MWEKCRDMQDELVKMRRELHRIPELGGNLPKTRAYVEEKLREYGIPFKENESDSGLTAEIKGGSVGKTIALRADMDAPPVKEANEVDYVSEHEGCMHACGHDAHMTMLLGAAKILNENREKLRGNVRLIFQTAEEESRGAERSIKEGCMERFMIGFYSLRNGKRIHIGSQGYGLSRTLFAFYNSYKSAVTFVFFKRYPILIKLLLNIFPGLWKKHTRLRDPVKLSAHPHKLILKLQTVLPHTQHLLKFGILL